MILKKTENNKKNEENNCNIGKIKLTGSEYFCGYCVRYHEIT